MTTLIKYSGFFGSRIDANFWAFRMADLATEQGFKMFIEKKATSYFVWRTVCERDSKLCIYSNSATYPIPNKTLIEYLTQYADKRADTTVCEMDTDKLLPVLPMKLRMSWVPDLEDFANLVKGGKK